MDINEMPSAKIDSQAVNQVRDLLNEVRRAKSIQQAQDAIQAATKVVEKLPIECRVPILQKAMGKGIRVWRSAASIIGRCTQSADLDRWIAAALFDADTERRGWIIQVIGNQRLVRFAPEINRIIQQDAECREWAIGAAGDLRTDANCDALVAYAESLGAPNIQRNLLIALSRFKSENVRPFLQYVFDNGLDDCPVFAAWGLGRLGDQNAIEYLVKLLDDDVINGHARRAAQALSDLFDWSLEWTPDAPKQAKECWLNMGTGDADKA